MKTDQITLAAELDSLPIFRKMLDNMCRGISNITEDTLYDLKLAVDEACTNVITHGYAGLNPGSLIVSCSIFPGKVVVSITDFGRPFEPSEAPQPDLNASLEERAVGGFGLYFIYQTMDEVAYQTSEDGNQLILTKLLKPVI